MREIKQDLFTFVDDPFTDAICITTNPHCTPDGLAFMGGGCAGIAARRWPQIAQNLGEFLLRHQRNTPFIIGGLDDDGAYVHWKSEQASKILISFPTINDLMEGSDLELIKQSAERVSGLADILALNKIILGRPGVGIGGLQWPEVKGVIKDILDDRFIVVSFRHEE